MDAPCATAAKPPTGRKMKARAPPPPGKPATPTAQRGQSPPRSTSPARQQNRLPLKESLRDRAVDLTVVLPSGLEKRSVVNGSHAVMDLLVELCLQNRLNPSHHALEIWSSDSQQPLSFKPNTSVGTLNVHTVFLKEKVPEEKAKPVPPKMPEKSVRLVVNYLRTQKAVVRVSPEVPLQNILPVICAKCDVSPEHVVLLRDNVAGEELELSKSLNELGIKELYAWDNKRETFRKASLSNDETDKEKKKFLGFFKVSKRSNSSKVELPRLVGADSDEDASRSVPGLGSNGCLTTPSSPSVNSRSVTLGPSLSLSNISGVSVRSDMKKRRAPPPPSLPASGPPAQDKASEKASLGSQMDLQKKKRRAPAPPPPSPRVPPRTEDREESRKGATGVGRQVPQKPPRGTARGPPQLVLPPPPPYPPPDTDAAEPLGFPGEGASEAADLSPTLSPPLGPGGPGSADGAPLAPSEAEETVSVGSCFASEDTTEDSGVVSSPSDIVSLDSQHDSTKSREKWAADQEACSDQDLAGPPDLGPLKSPAWERNGSRCWHSRIEKTAAASDDDRDLFIARRFEQTPAELDEDPEDMEDSYETDASSLTSSVDGGPGRGTQGASGPDMDPEAIPVTFIGEVDDPVEPGLFSNSNNNAGSFDRGRVASRSAHPPPAPAGPPQRGRKRVDEPDAAPPPRDAGKDARWASADTCKGVRLLKAEPRLASELRRQEQSLQERGREHSSARRDGAPSLKALSSLPWKDKDSDDEKEVSPPLSWCQRGQSPGGSFGLKYGLTTYKIVPPKSDRRCYDRGVSLSTGAIKIDELGNLVSPHVNGGRTMALPPPALEKDAQPLGGIRELRRHGSGPLEKRSGRSLGSSAREPPAPAAPVKAPHQDGRGGAELSSPDPTATSPLQPPGPQGDGRQLQEGRSRPTSAAACSVKVPAAHATQVPFLKPQRRTSSQYVASAIAKRIGPPRAHAEGARKRDEAEKAWEGGGRERSWRPRATEDAAARSPRLETQEREEEVKAPCSRLPNAGGEASAGGAQPQGPAGSPPGKRPPQGPPTGAHRGTCVPRAMAAQRAWDSVALSCGAVGKQGPGVHRTSSAPDPERTPDGSTAPPGGSGDARTPGGSLANGSRWVPDPGEPPHAPRAPGTSRPTALWQEDKPGVPCTDIQDPDSTLPPSIFGPKKKFRPVVQRPAPKDTCLHSALMEAIHAAGGKDRLRKTAEPGSEGGPKKLSYVEAESEHSALLAAIRGHRGACSLRKVASCASEELRSFREAASSAHRSEAPGLDTLASQPPPALPPPSPPAAPAPAAPRTAARSSSSSGPLRDPVDARQALMDAIRSGTGAARLRKVPLLV
ncbi:protein cordon-bleu isoform X2 [Pteronotus mesoamericanus]|uniref:protein cordon-bleu isoform X2 n=1 Tax=Pteronotus mesoamericanus TaxID=1884717 RepID=UPI0023ECC958|nr:protein cordon-bleu isoform X2 [Pteronotus parnellii mesoamericanus]